MNWLKSQTNRHRQESAIDTSLTCQKQKAHAAGVERSLEVQILLARPQF